MERINQKHVIRAGFETLIASLKYITFVAFL